MAVAQRQSACAPKSPSATDSSNLMVNERYSQKEYDNLKIPKPGQRAGVKLDCNFSK